MGGEQRLDNENVVGLRRDPAPRVAAGHDTCLRELGLVLLLLLVGVLVGCAENMRDQPRYEPYEKSAFFADGQSSRPLVPDTVPRGQARTDEHLYTGRVNGTPVATFPFPVTREVLARGQERYDIYCAVCHGRVGDGQGMIVQRGFSPPPSFHTDHLRAAPAGHFYEVITNGYGAMYSYASRVPPEDRWAIVAYIRALQLSQNATIDDVPPAEQDRLR